MKKATNYNALEIQINPRV